MVRGVLFVLFGLGLIGVGAKGILDDRRGKANVIDGEIAEE